MLAVTLLPNLLKLRRLSYFPFIRRDTHDEIKLWTLEPIAIRKPVPTTQEHKDADDRTDVVHVVGIYRQGSREAKEDRGYAHEQHSDPIVQRAYQCIELERRDRRAV